MLQPNLYETKDTKYKAQDLTLISIENSFLYSKLSEV